MKRVLAAAAMMAVLVAPAASQVQMGQGGQKTPLQLQYEKEAQDQKANEQAYNEQMKRMKSQAPAAKSDPWAGVRAPSDTTNAKR